MRITGVTKHLLSIISFTLLLAPLSGQEIPAFIKENAVNIDRLDSLDNKVYHLLTEFRLVMVGEMHGTNEPAKFVIGLTRLLRETGDSVQVGLEIPSGKMTGYINQPSNSNLYSSDFFALNSGDGRASVAWAELISSIDKDPKVRIFFFDVNIGECKNPGDRDSIMYLKVKDKIREHPKWKTITLSGNIHTMLLPYKEKTKMSLFLSRDEDLHLTGRICSLNHVFGSGTMMNNTGNGLELGNIDNSLSDYSTAVDYENYILLYNVNANNRYSGVFFTRIVTAAKMTSK